MQADAPAAWRVPIQQRQDEWRQEYAATHTSDPRDVADAAADDQRSDERRLRRCYVVGSTTGRHQHLPRGDEEQGSSENGAPRMANG